MNKESIYDAALPPPARKNHQKKAERTSVHLNHGAAHTPDINLPAMALLLDHLRGHPVRSTLNAGPLLGQVWLMSMHHHKRHS